MIHRSDIDLNEVRWSLLLLTLNAIGGVLAYLVPLSVAARDVPLDVFCGGVCGMALAFSFMMWKRGW